jgi:hypothetical protein
MPFYYSPYRIAQEFSEAIIEPTHRSTNILEVAKPADKTTISKDQIHNAKIFIQETPYQGNAQVLILKDADWMAEEQQNILLKILEEPPQHTIIFLLSPYRQLLPTIQSRAHKIATFDFTQNQTQRTLLQDFLTRSPDHERWVDKFTTKFPTNFLEATLIIQEITQNSSERIALEGLLVWSMLTNQSPTFKLTIQETMHTVFFTNAKNDTAMENMFLQLLH